MNVLSKLYPFQKDAVTETFYSPKGIICLPTGTGKTFCQASIIANDITLNIDQFRMYVVNAPRILLTYQLLKETYSFLAQNNIEARYMFVHSGGQMGESGLEDIRTKANLDGSDIPFSEIVSTTDIKTIREMMLVSKKQSLPLIIFSTYNSADKIEIARKDLQPISIILNDEAHYLVQEQFHNILKDITYSRCYFFTATMINTTSDCGRGMNNIELYGETLYQMIPREAIVLGKMIRPRIHVVKTEGVYDIEDFDKSLNKIIYESFYQHGSFISDNKDIAPKMLVSVKGTNDIEKFLESDEYKTLRSENVSIYAVASREEIGNNINGNKVRRQDFLKTLSLESKDFNQKIIILHYDVLSEGIDIPSITGIMPLRSLNKSKFLQTFGRAARLDKRDRDNFENNIYAPTDLYKMYKPYAYIIIPNVIHSNEDDRVNLTQIITELRSYGFNPSEDIISSSRVNGIPTIEELTGLNDIKTKIPNIGELIENLEADIEKEEN
jgi:superfamily II DNA or RNA helicase